MKKHNCYLIKRENEYLVSVTETPKGSGNRKPVFSVYRYDGARVRRLWQAETIISWLRENGETCKPVIFNSVTGMEAEIHV